MYNPELEDLIEAALTDGELNEKEKQILFKRAQAEGIDLDEFELILNSRILKLKKKKDGEPTESAPKSNKIGDVKKCPACGAMVPPYHSACPECGYQFNDIGTSKSVERFAEQLSAIESGRVASRTKESKGCAYYLVIVCFWMFIIPIKAVKILLNVASANSGAKPREWDVTDRKKEEFIMNYPIPISFGEMVEFLSLANSRVKKLNFAHLIAKSSAYDMAWNKIWMTKINQIETKAMIAMKDDPDMLNQVTTITQQAKQTDKQNIKMGKIIIFCGFVLTSLYTILLLIFMFA